MVLPLSFSVLLSLDSVSVHVSVNPLGLVLEPSMAVLLHSILVWHWVAPNKLFAQAMTRLGNSQDPWFSVTQAWEPGKREGVF